MLFLVAFPYVGFININNAVFKPVCQKSMAPAMHCQIAQLRNPAKLMLASFFAPRNQAAPSINNSRQHSCFNKNQILVNYSNNRHKALSDFFTVYVKIILLHDK